jgi:hypothetical protein
MLGFILTRHVNSETTNKYWNESCRCIRKFYPTEHILIIDDNSNQDFVSENQIENVTIIQSPFKGRGEILAYYYFYMTRLFDKAVILHDSVFLHQPLDIDSVKDVAFLWSFNNCFRDDIKEEEFLGYLENNYPLIDTRRQLQWRGCFGCMSVITRSFLETIVQKYSLFNILEHVYSRNERYHIERLIAVLCYTENPNVSSLFGDIHLYQRWGLTYDEYKEECHTRPITKVWSGR